MLIGNTAKRPSLHAVRKLKRVLGEALDLPEGAMVTVTQLACLEVDCAPLETVAEWPAHRANLLPLPLSLALHRRCRLFPRGHPA